MVSTHEREDEGTISRPSCLRGPQMGKRSVADSGLATLEQREEERSLGVPERSTSSRAARRRTTAREEAKVALGKSEPARLKETAPQSARAVTRVPPCLRVPCCAVVSHQGRRKEEEGRRKEEGGGRREEAEAEAEGQGVD